MTEYVVRSALGVISAETEPARAVNPEEDAVFQALVAPLDGAVEIKDEADIGEDTEVEHIEEPVVAAAEVSDDFDTPDRRKGPGAYTLAGTLAGLAVVALAASWGSPKPSKQQQAANAAKGAVARARKSGASGGQIKKLEKQAAQLQDIATQHAEAKDHQVWLRQQEAERDRLRRMGRGQTSDGSPGSPYYEGSGR